MNKLKLTFWLSLAITIAIYAVMSFYSLPIITGNNSDLLIFDIRPNGYSFTDAQSLLNALSSEGILFYQTTQLALDTVFPIFYALSFMLAFWILAPIKLGKWRLLFFPFAIIAMVFDFLENASVVKMLQAGADGISTEMVQSASDFSTLKYLFINISLAILVILIGLWIYKEYFSKAHQ